MNLNLYAEFCAMLAALQHQLLHKNHYSEQIVTVYQFHEQNVYPKLLQPLRC